MEEHRERQDHPRLRMVEPRRKLAALAVNGEIAAFRDFNIRSRNGHIQKGAQGPCFQRVRKRETGLHHRIEHSLQMWVDHRALPVIQLLRKPENSF